MNARRLVRDRDRTSVVLAGICIVVHGTFDGKQGSSVQQVVQFRPEGSRAGPGRKGVACGFFCNGTGFMRLSMYQTIQLNL